jgi:aspartate/methionine/tyrosine aminotransferase
VIVSPDNPLGVVCPAGVLEQLIALCRELDITLLVDHCLAELNPWRRQIPSFPASSPPFSSRPRPARPSPG